MLLLEDYGGNVEVVKSKDISEIMLFLVYKRNILKLKKKFNEKYYNELYFIKFRLIKYISLVTTSAKNYITNSILNVQENFGEIPNIFAVKLNEICYTN